MSRLGILSTAANPLHIGHLNMLHWYEDNVSDKVVIEIAACNADKGSLEDQEIVSRGRQIASIARRFLVSYQPTYVSKIYDWSGYLDMYKELVPPTPSSSYSNFGVDFLVGYDTYQRILDPKYYFDSERERNRCINLFLENNVKFYVFPRIIDGISTRISYTNDLFVGVEKFVPIDISSTQIRNQSDNKY